MTKLSIRALSAGLAAALICAPLAFAQQQPQHAGDTHDQAGHGQPSHAAPSRPSVSHTQVTQTPVRQSQASHSSGTHSGMTQPGHIAPPPSREASAPQHGAPGPQRSGYNSGHTWHQGDHYNGNRDVVSNWNDYHLRQPPQGYEWVQDGSQFVLVAVASGVIADVILNALNQ
jgi:Ni/Co efflux regulator RcnB